jgi:predicted component of type VI protein secretion system
MSAVTASIVVASGKEQGRSLIVSVGSVLRVGRSPAADLSVPDDDRLSRFHFSVESDGAICRVRDLGSRNGTRVNGRAIAEAIVRDGDAVAAGHSVFTVHLAVDRPEVAPAAEPASRSAFGTGAWALSVVPAGWTAYPASDANPDTVAAYARRPDEPPASVLTSADPLPAGESLDAYVEAQLALCRDTLTDIRVDGPCPASIAGSEAALEVTIRHRADDGSTVWHRQLYARGRSIVGVATITLTDPSAPNAAAAADRIRRALAFRGR